MKLIKSLELFNIFSSNSLFFIVPYEFQKYLSIELYVCVILEETAL